MRELTLVEVEEVSGGVGPGGAVLGALTSGISSYYTGGNAGQIAAATILGGVGGFFGSVALSGVASRATSAMFGAYSVEVSVMAGVAGS